MLLASLVVATTTARSSAEPTDLIFSPPGNPGIWYIYNGISMVYLWYLYGISMVTLYGRWMANSWATLGHPAVGPCPIIASDNSSVTRKPVVLDGGTGGVQMAEASLGCDEQQGVGGWCWSHAFKFPVGAFAHCPRQLHARVAPRVAGSVACWQRKPLSAANARSHRQTP
jgi:hypothetical protein